MLTILKNWATMVSVDSIVLAFVFAGPVYDLVTRRRVHPAYFFSVPLAFLATPPMAMLLSATGAWHRITAVLLR